MTMSTLRANITRTNVLGIIALLAFPAMAHEPLRPPGGGMQGGRPKAAACVPASAITEISYNNVRAVIENGGNMWTRRSGTSSSGYEVPKTADFSGPKALYAGGLWMGGRAVDGNTKIAAVLFRADGNDFWPGPLREGGDASVSAATCEAYDRFWTTTRADAEAHIQYIACQDDPECDVAAIFPDGYSTPPDFLSWPAEGNLDEGQSAYLAPFFDNNNDGVYDPSEGDYPDYGFDETVEECKNRQRDDAVNLFGDYNIFWIFNDKGDVHTESNGQPIGLEVRAQAFAFSSNNEINNMTFYNYTVINQGSQTLTNTYFGSFVDPDVGCSNDDFVGCDVRRGLGFAYNWDENDEACLGAPGYGVQPPAIGVDFFEGPYQDADGIDNPGPQNNVDVLDCVTAQQQNGIPYKGIGIGYGDGFADNERFGMRAFLYWNREGAFATNDPEQPSHFYNYLQSIWKDGTAMTYGGSGYSTTGAGIPTRYMFPWSTDVVGWGTNCAPQPDWREGPQQPQDRRFVQSAGPFTLEPGAFNNITLGVVYSRSATGGSLGSVASLKVADDKAQSLFDNCFKILDGPDAPDLRIVELDRELVIFMTNPSSSNNNNVQALDYAELDPIIPESKTTETITPVFDTLGTLPLDTVLLSYDTTITTVIYDRFYRFQGYKLFQLKNSEVSVSELNDPDLARLVYQGDIKDGIGQLVNYPTSDILQLPVATEMVNGADNGVASSVRILEDKFAQGDTRLVNFKSYYYLAIAYGYNNYENYDPVNRTGQAFTYVESRKGAVGSIRKYVAIPHRNDPQTGGTILNAQYGDGLPVTRIEGQGNGGLETALSEASELEIVSDTSINRKDMITYLPGLGPIGVKVVDPLKLPAAEFEVWFQDSVTSGNLNDAYWYVVNRTSNDTVLGERAIDLPYEQIIPEWGISISIAQTLYTGINQVNTDPVGEGSIEFEDPSKPWFTGLPDGEGEQVENWIRSGNYRGLDNGPIYDDRGDFDQLYEKMLNGTWGPWNLAGQAPFQPGCRGGGDSPHASQTATFYSLRDLPSVQLVMTKNKDLWSRSPVFEQEDVTANAEGGAQRMGLRISPSIDKQGIKTGQPGCNEAEAQFIKSTGMGWFPGYVIDLETGERLNIGYGENSFWGGSIGRDMIFNPNDKFYTETGSPFFGGEHWIYIFKNDRRVNTYYGTPNQNRVPLYDAGKFIADNLVAGSSAARITVFRAIAWVGSAMVVPGQEFLATDVRIRLNVAKEYRTYEDYAGNPDPIVPLRNNGLPLYSFTTNDLAVIENDQATAESALDLINVVPNPYYAFSGYETSRLDNRIKFINLPQKCTISIFSVNGTLVRKFRKDNGLTFLDWDLKNANNIPIAGGVYICHVDVPGVGEKVVKWFGALRPIDLQNF